MSQVKKLKKGNVISGQRDTTKVSVVNPNIIKTPFDDSKHITSPVEENNVPEKTEGVFRMNGRELRGQKALDAIAKVMTATIPEERYMMSPALRAVQDGKIVEYDLGTNGISITESNGNSITDRYFKTGKRIKNLDKLSLEHLGEVSMFDNSFIKKSDSKPSLDILKRGSGWFSYDSENKNEKGNPLFHKDWASNIHNFNIINNIENYLSKNKEFDTSDWSPEDLSYLQDWYNARGINDVFGNLKYKIEAGTLNANDLDVLKRMGFSKEDVEEMQKETPSSNDGITFSEGWNGDRDAATRAGVGFVLKDDGWHLTGDSDYGKNTWYTGGMDFLKGTQFEGGAIHNGQLFTKEEVLKGDPRIARHIAPFIRAGRMSKDWKSWYDAANSSNVRFIGDRISSGQSENPEYYGEFGLTYNPYTAYNKYWYNYLNPLGNRDWNVNDITGSFDNLNGRRVLAYIDPSSKNEMGIFSPKFVVRESDGSYSNPFNSEKDLLEAYGFNNNTDFYSANPTNWENSTWIDINNKKYAYYNPLEGKNNQQNVVIYGQDGNYYLARRNGEKLVNPILINNTDLLEKYIQNPGSFSNSDLEALYKKEGMPKNFKEARKVANTNVSNSINSNSFYMPLRKEGGVIPIPKLLYGSTISSSINTATEKDFSNEKMDYSSPHSIKNPEDLTDAEWWQIGAALGDLAGVGVSFIPGANIAGAATGAAASTARLVGDIKQDGFDWKDAANFGTNLLLDMASIIPILGSGAKATKAAKAIKSVGGPLLKALSLYGAGDAIYNSVNKIVKGEDWTSADLTKAIQGIGALGISADSAIKGVRRAKLAQTVESRSIKSPDLKKKITINGKTIEEDLEGISKLTEDSNSGNDLIKAYITKLKETNNIDVSAKDAESALKELGVNFSKKPSFKLNGFHNPFSIKKDAKFELPKEEKASSWISYYLRPRKEWKILDSAKHSKVGSTISREEMESAVKAIKNGTASGQQKALVELASGNPQVFGDMFGYKGQNFKSANRTKKWYYRDLRNPVIWRYDIENPNVPVPKFESMYGKYYGPTNGYKPKMSSNLPSLANSPLLSRFALEGVPETTLPSESLSRLNMPSKREIISNPLRKNVQIPTEAEAIRMYQSDLGIGDDLGEIISVPGKSLSPYFYDTSLSTAYRHNTNITPMVELLKKQAFKKGGKIQKMQNGSSFTPIKKPEITIPKIDPSSKFKFNINNINYLNTKPVLNPLNTSFGNEETKIAYNAASPEVQSVFDEHPELFKQVITDGVKTSDLKVPVQEPESEIKVDKSGVKTFTELGFGSRKKPFFNSANAADAIKATLMSLTGDRNIRDQIKGFNRLKQVNFDTYQINKPTFDNSVIDRTFDNAQNKLKSVNTVTSDSMIKLASDLATSEKSAEIERQRGIETTSNINNYNTQRLKTETYNGENRIKSLNEKSKYNANIDYQIAMAPILWKNQKWANIWEPYSRQRIIQMRQWQDQHNALQSKNELTRYNNQRNARIENDLIGYKSEYYNDPNRGTKTFEEWMASDPIRYKKYLDVQQLTGNEQKTLNDIDSGYINRNGPFIYSAKKGGKVRSVKEQTTIDSFRAFHKMNVDSNKAAQKAVLDMSNNLVKLLQQMIK